MKTRLSVLLATLNAVAAVLIWSEARSTAIMAALGFHTARKEVREVAVARQLDRQIAVVNDSFSRITGFAIAAALLSSCSVLLLVRAKKPNQSSESASDRLRLVLTQDEQVEDAKPKS